MAIKGFRGPRIEIICPCGNKVYAIESLAKIKKYCCRKCRDKYKIHWSKDKVFSNSYNAIHFWVRKKKGKPTVCEKCGESNKKIWWANKSHQYKRELEDWMALCWPCHLKHDLDESGMKRGDTLKFPEIAAQRLVASKRRFTKEEIIEIYTSDKPQIYFVNKFNVEQSLLAHITNGRLYKKYTKNLIRAVVKPQYIKLDETIAWEVLNSNLKGRELAKIYNISEPTISGIRHGRVWRQVYDRFKNMSA